MITADIIACNCTAPSSLFIDDIFVMNGTLQDMILKDGKWFERYSYAWDSSSVPNGIHKIEVKGKHKESFDLINVSVYNEIKEGEREQNLNSFPENIICIIPIILIISFILRKKTVRRSM